MCDPETCAALLSTACEAVCHQAAMVGLGVDFDDVADYVHHNDLGTAVLLRALARERFVGRLVLASSMVVYGEGALRLRTARAGRPAPAAARGPGRRRFEPALPALRRASCDRGAVPETAPLDPRNVYAATKPHQEHLCFAFCPRDGRARDRAALPQRLRPADAPRHALRRRGGDLRQRAGGRRARRACSRTGGSCATSSTCAMSRVPMCSR